MIVDAHRHLLSAYERYPLHFPGKAPVGDLDPDRLREIILREMDGAGIGVSVLLTADFDAAFGPTKWGMAAENAAVLEVANRHEDRFIPLFGIDPRRPEALPAFAAAIKAGARGLKLHPSAGFRPDAKIVAPFYQMCASRGLPVLVHVGDGFHSLLSDECGRAEGMWEVAAAFPGVTFILAHAGRPYWQESLALAEHFHNVALELSEWQHDLSVPESGARRAISEIVRRIGSERVLWGSDFPGAGIEMSMTETIALFNSPGFADLDENAVADIMGRNAVRVFGD